MRAPENPDQQSLVSQFEIFRGDLAQILYDMTKDNEKIKYVYGEQVSSMQRMDDGPITIDFANGFPASEYDLVVACDGANSGTRAIGLDCDVQDHIIPVNCWAAYFSVQQDLLEGSKIGQSWSTMGGRWLSIGPDPSGVTRVTMMGIKPRNDREAMLPFREAAKGEDDALKHYIFQQFEGAGWKTDEILKGMMSAEDFYASETVQVKVPSLHKGRFVLVGDAGYAPGPTGTSTSLAIAGAYLLAGEVGRHQGDLAAGLRGYEKRMRPIINDLQKLSPGVPGMLAPQTAGGIQQRNITLAFMAWCMSWSVGLSRVFAWTGKLFGSSMVRDKYGIPDYEDIDGWSKDPKLG